MPSSSERLLDAVQPQRVGDVFVDGFWKRIRSLEHHADALAQFDHVHLAAVDVVAAQSGSRPSMRTLSMRSFMRLRQRSKVDLPQPDGPMNAVTSFSLI